MRPFDSDQVCPNRTFKIPPIRSFLVVVQNTWKVEKCRLQQSYNTTPDTFVKSIAPKVRSGRVWSAEDSLRSAERDLECEAMRGMIQPHFRAGIGFGEWVKPWERLSKKEKEEAVMSRVKTNIEQERVNSIWYTGNAEQMGRLARRSFGHGLILEQHVQVWRFTDRFCSEGSVWHCNNIWTYLYAIDYISYN